jgi:hypothetical protein
MEADEPAWGAASEAVRLEPYRADAHVALAVVGHRLPPRRYDAWLAACRAAELEPMSPVTHLALGFTSHALGFPDEAESHYREALRLDPHNAAASNDLTVVRHGLSLGKAAQGFSGALAIDPSTTESAENIERLATRFMIRVYLICWSFVLLMMVVVLATGMPPGISRVRAVLGGVMLLVVTTYTVWELRQVPRSAVRLIRARLTSRKDTRAALILAGVALVVGCLLSFVPLDRFQASGAPPLVGFVLWGGARTWIRLARSRR